MDQDQVEGTVRKVGGRVADAAGGLVGDAGMQVKGKAQQVLGSAQQRYGDALDTLQSYTKDNPLAMLGLAAGGAFLIGYLLGRR